MLFSCDFHFVFNCDEWLFVSNEQKPNKRWIIFQFIVRFLIMWIKVQQKNSAQSEYAPSLRVKDFSRRKTSEDRWGNMEDTRNILSCRLDPHPSSEITCERNQWLQTAISLSPEPFTLIVKAKVKSLNQINAREKDIGPLVCIETHSEWSSQSQRDYGAFIANSNCQQMNRSNFHNRLVNNSWNIKLFVGDTSGIAGILCVFGIYSNNDSIFLWQQSSFENWVFLQLSFFFLIRLTPLLTVLGLVLWSQRGFIWLWYYKLQSAEYSYSNAQNHL